MNIYALGLVLSLSFSVYAGDKSSTRKPAEAKATVCYDESMKYAAVLASDAKAEVRKGKLEMFDNIGEIQVEGWSFPVSNGHTIIIVASADGTGKEMCRTNLLYNK